MKTDIQHPRATLIEWEQGRRRSLPVSLVEEEPLSIRVQGKPYAVIMRTPGEEREHVAGFCLAEGIIDSPADIAAIGYCDGPETNVVTITLTAECKARIPEILERRNFISQTSCGLCGKELVNDLYQVLRPLEGSVAVDTATAAAALAALSAHQPMRRATKASHAAALFDAGGGLLAVAEDVGRHNALDKAIGRVFLEERLGAVAFAALSSRVSYELVQKAARARIPILLAHSRPTSLAVALAERLKIAIAALNDNDGLYIFCTPWRLNP